jgi:hypothetical protein
LRQHGTAGQAVAKASFVFPNTLNLNNKQLFFAFISAVRRARALCEASHNEIQPLKTTMHASLP